MTARFAHVRRALALAALLAVAACGSSRGPAARPSSAPPLDPVAELEAARAALEADPGDVEARFRYGLAWQARAEKVAAGTAPAYRDSARTAFEAVLEARPDDPRALVHLGLVLEDLGQQDKALALYERGTEVAPDDPLPWINRASLLYFHFKRTYEAKEALSRALALDPDNPDARFNLGVMFADANLFREARVEWERVLETAADGPARTLAEQNLERIRPLVAAQDSAAAR